MKTKAENIVMNENMAEQALVMIKLEWILTRYKNNTLIFFYMSECELDLNKSHDGAFVDIDVYGRSYDGNMYVKFLLPSGVN